LQVSIEPGSNNGPTEGSAQSGCALDPATSPASVALIF
jgi:hypothetical protein